MWVESKFNLENFKEQKDNFVLEGNEDLILRVEESIIILNNMQSNKFSEIIRDEV